MDSSTPGTDSTTIVGWSRVRYLVLFSVLSLIVGCAAYTGYRLDQTYGPANPTRFDQTNSLAAAQAPVEYFRNVKPITDKRCAVCHGCFDAPCQLQMGSVEGITRGANKTLVYDAVRLFAADPSRLFVDAQSNAAWRLKGFHPVLNEREPTQETNIDASVMAQMLNLKAQHHFIAGAPLPDKRFDFSLDRKQSCPTIAEFDGFAEEHPDWGMPYGLPALSKKEQQTLKQWLANGAPAAGPKPPTPAELEQVASWENFLNGSTFKSQLMARYIFEHWFLAHFYFNDLQQSGFFELVRSKTPPSQAIQLIASRRPYDDPGVPRVYYRLRPVQGAILAKTHMPYALNAARMARIKSWFVDDSYQVTRLPSYDPIDAANPFVTFEQIPVRSRYRLMLDEAQFTLMGFIKGPVCRGQVALNVISDYFWVGFTNPEHEETSSNANFLSKVLQNVRLPSEQESDANLLKWKSYARMENQYLRQKSEYLNQKMVGSKLPNLDMLWQGDGSNQNAALTIFRHFDSASVVKGLVGDKPQTAIIMSYTLLERMHYLLVAGFDVYGNLAHQLVSRLYMDFLRMEGELNVLALLPKESRNQVRDFWYRNASGDVKEYLNGSKAFFYQDSGIDYKTDAPWPELLGLWKAYLNPVLDKRYDLTQNQLSTEEWELIRQLSSLKGKAVSYLPEVVFLTVVDEQKQEHRFTILRNSAHSNISQMFNEDKRRLPEEDTLTVVPGFLGAYPNAFYRVESLRLPKFVKMVGNLQSEADYAVLCSRYAIRRTDNRFWTHSDSLIEDYRKTYPIEAGLFDYNRFENR